MRLCNARGQTLRLCVTVTPPHWPTYVELYPAPNYNTIIISTPPPTMYIIYHAAANHKAERMRGTCVCVCECAGAVAWAYSVRAQQRSHLCTNQSPVILTQYAWVCALSTEESNVNPGVLRSVEFWASVVVDVWRLALGVRRLPRCFIENSCIRHSIKLAYSVQY